MKATLACLLLASAFTSTFAQTTVYDPWVRASVDATNSSVGGVNSSVLATKAAVDALRDGSLPELAKQTGYQLQLVDQLLKQGKVLNSQEWGNAVAQFKQLQDLYTKAGAVLYAAEDSDKQYRERNPQYQAALAEQFKASNKSVGDFFSNRAETLSKDYSDQVANTLKTLYVVQSQVSEERTFLDGLQTLSDNAEGQMQAVQVGNKIAMQTVVQLQKVRELLAVMTRSQTYWNEYSRQLAMSQAEAGSQAAADYKAGATSGSSGSGGTTSAKRAQNALAALKAKK
jgi:P-type conjugative transfer protein TrbJ